MMKNEPERMPRWLGLLIMALLVFLLGFAAAFAVSRASAQTILFEDDFNDGFPGPEWRVDWISWGLTWDDDDCRAIDGRALWCANGRKDQGTNGLDPCRERYPNSMNARAILGPYDFTHITDAYIAFDWWLRSEQGEDFLYIVWSHRSTGYPYHGFLESGDHGDLWHRDEVVPMFGAAGLPEVWIFVGFAADPVMSMPRVVPNGAFIDNVRVHAIQDSTDIPPDEPEEPEDPVPPDTTDCRAAIAARDSVWTEELRLILERMGR